MLAALTTLPARVRQCALSHAVDAAVASRASAGVAVVAAVAAGGAGCAAVPAITAPAALAAHVHAAITAWAERAEWRCQPDEPQWRLAGAVTEVVAFGVDRPSVSEGYGPLPDLLAAFIDCQWPLRYLKRPTPD